ncbi:MAG: O-antigen ligase family protein, partial [Methylovulum sp.]|nr:O-antigen ligase family protein [Methylovulum sp.]
LFFVVPGRRGQVLVVALALLFAWQCFNVKGRLLAIVLVAVSLALFLGFSDKAVRLQEGIANTQTYLIKPEPEQVPSSMGLRYGFWQNSLKLMGEKPLLGYGTGSFNKEYQRLVVDGPLLTTNPHNEFLMIGVQLGAVGLVFYCGFLWSQLVCARRLPKPEHWLAQGLLLSLVVTSLFNSPLLDHAEGHWFAVLIALCYAPLYWPDIQPAGQSV